MTRVKTLLVLLTLLCLGSTATGQTVLYDFYADWCGPCQAMRPTVDCLLREGYRVQQVNIDQDRPLAAKYGVESVPCFVMVQDGREIDRAIGWTSYSRLAAMFRSAERRQPSEIKMAMRAEGGERKAEFQAPSPQPPIPHPAWRYERAVGHRAAVVRIFSQDDARTRSIGSGTLVKWRGSVVILTARHVIQDAKKILVWFCTGKTGWARVLSADATWDVAVLETDATPDGVEPVELELGADAMQQEGNRLESCGYGPDGKLACNSGLFVGYRRSSVAPRGPDDWMAISGHARGGDSGGAVFNHRGRLVGVLWGTDGKEVVCVQAGRLHVLLDAAVSQRRVEPKALIPMMTMRTPTPPLEAAQPTPIESLPCCPEQDVRQASMGGPAKERSIGQIFGRKPIPAPAPPPVVVQPDPEVRHALGNIDAKVGMLIEQRQPTQPADETEKNEASPLVAGLCILAGIVVGFVIYFATQK